MTSRNETSANERTRHANSLCGNGYTAHQYSIFRSHCQGGDRKNAEGCAGSACREPGIILQVFIEPIEHGIAKMFELRVLPLRREMVCAFILDPLHLPPEP